MNTIEQLKSEHKDFYDRIISNLPPKFKEEDLFVLDNFLVGAKNKNSIQFFGCPLCYKESIYFGNDGNPTVRGNSLIRLNDPSTPSDIAANLLYCPQCKMLVNLFPNYNRQIME